MGDREEMLFSPERLAAALNGPQPPVVADCRFDLLNPEAGRTAWAAGHVPGAYYADLDRDLAAARRANTGRHPLPDADSFADLLGRWGLTRDRWLVVYDDAGGAVAARLWWLARWAGHRRVALLDGGLQAWTAAGYSLSTALPAAQNARYPVDPRQRPTVTTDELLTELEQHTVTLIDARDPVRFGGGAEPIDPVAGHVPGAVNRPFAANLNDRGCFRSSAELADDFASLLAGRPARVVMMCGSGVTACHNLFAFELAGGGDAALYVDSWSGWITDPDRPVARD